MYSHVDLVVCACLLKLKQQICSSFDQRQNWYCFLSCIIICAAFFHADLLSPYRYLPWIYKACYFSCWTRTFPWLAKENRWYSPTKKIQECHRGSLNLCSSWCLMGILPGWHKRVQILITKFMCIYTHTNIYHIIYIYMYTSYIMYIKK